MQNCGRELSEKLVVNGYKRVKVNFIWDKKVEETIKIFMEALEE